MPADNPLDRAATALWSSRNSRLPESLRRDPEPEDMVKLRLDAVAMLKAIHEPSKRMLEKMAARMSPANRPTEWVSCKAKHALRYQAAIDAIIAEQESSR